MKYIKESHQPSTCPQFIEQQVQKSYKLEPKNIDRYYASSKYKHNDITIFFFINKKVDTGWLVLSDVIEVKPCKWEEFKEYPQFLYKKNWKVDWKTWREF